MPWRAAADGRPAPRARARPARCGRAGALRAAGRADRGPAGGRRAGRRWPADEGCARRSRCWRTRRTSPGGRRSGRSPSSPRSGRRSAGRLERGVPVRFFDLPAAHSLALAEQDEGEDETGPADGRRGLRAEPEPGEEGETVPDGADGGGAVGDTGTGTAAANGAASRRTSARPAGRPMPEPGTSRGRCRHRRRHGTDAGTGRRGDGMRLDPLAALAEAAGYDDPERWWEDVVEHRGAGSGTRADPWRRSRRSPRPWPRCGRRHGDGGHRTGPGARGAHAAAPAGGAQGVRRRSEAVVCGAWHVPALTAPTDRRPPTAALLKGLPKVKAEITWVPWTHGRLAPAQRLRRGHRLARLVPPPVHRARPAGRALADRGRRAAARRGPARLLGARHRGRPARRDPGRAARPAAGRADAR